MVLETLTPLTFGGDAQWDLSFDKRAKLAGLVPALEKQFPGDLWLERLRIDASRTPSGAVPDSLVAEYERRYNTALKDSDAAFLYGYALIHKDSRRAIELLTPLSAGDTAMQVAILL